MGELLFRDKNSTRGGVVMNSKSPSKKYQELISLAIIPTMDVVVFPTMVVPLLVLDEKIINGIDQALTDNKPLLVVATRPQNNNSLENDIGVEDLYTTGTICEILKVVELPEEGIKVLVRGIERAEIISLENSETLLLAEVEEAPIKEASQEEVEGAIRGLTALIEQVPTYHTRFGNDFSSLLAHIENPYKIVDLIVSHLSLSVQEIQSLFQTPTLIEVFKKLSKHISDVITSCEIEESIKHSTRESINKSQREFFLREQLRAIQKELGDDPEDDFDQLTEQLNSLPLSTEAFTEVEKQIKRLKKTAPDSLEATVIRNHIEWILHLPWGKHTKDNQELSHAQEVLESHHFGLQKVKERILDYLAVKFLKNDCQSPILCLVGPPGVGKTSLGKSIADAMQRTFARIALGGVTDEGEIRGHRRTYVGALPGRFIQAIKRSQSMNPVFLLDEIDKMGASHKGDPASSLLEVLDPEQNKAFYDNYLGIHVDFSRILFIATANDINAIPGPLRDRMEVIDISGYTTEEKVEIAKRHLIPSIISNTGLENTPLSFSDKLIKHLINHYTLEAGVRTLSQLIQKLCAKYARFYLEKKTHLTFTPETISDHLGPALREELTCDTSNRIGITNGLAWTPYGGKVLQVEAILMPGSGKLLLTGQLGEVMKESAQAAVSYARAHAFLFNIPEEMFTQYDLHIHLPAGAIPKDGPSAGITLLSSIFSVYTKRPINGNIAMTGELSLQGNVLPIGGVKEKLLAAQQQGLSKVLLPIQNKRDTVELAHLLKGIEVTFVSKVEEVLHHILLPISEHSVS